jgi:hypothetical protein
MESCTETEVYGVICFLEAESGKPTNIYCKMRAIHGNIYLSVVGFEVFAVEVVKISVIWDITSCRLLKIN